jgi:hypothetical protein
MLNLRHERFNILLLQVAEVAALEMLLGLLVVAVAEVDYVQL